MRLFPGDSSRTGFTAGLLGGEVPPYHEVPSEEAKSSSPLCKNDRSDESGVQEEHDERDVAIIHLNERSEEQ